MLKMEAARSKPCRVTGDAGQDGPAGSSWLSRRAVSGQKLTLAGHDRLPTRREQAAKLGDTITEIYRPNSSNKIDCGFSHESWHGAASQ